MTIEHTYKIVTNTMKELEDIDFISIDKRKQNQVQVNKAYKTLDSFKDELIREYERRKEHKRYD